MTNEPEDYPGQADEIRRNDVISRAVAAADEIIIEGSSGEAAETDYLTAAVAKAFAELVFGKAQSELLKADLAKRFAEKP